MNYKLFVDDLRTPRMVWYMTLYAEFEHDDEWVVAENYDEAVDIIERCGCPQYISFDHDLGYGKTGMDLAKWFVDRVMDDNSFIHPEFRYYVHSANPVGTANIYGLLDNLTKEVS